MAPVPLSKTTSKTKKPGTFHKESKESRRGRSRSRTRSSDMGGSGIVQMDSAPTRGRSSSRARSSSAAKQSLPVAVKTKKGRSGSRPPPTTSTKRTRSTSRTSGTRTRSVSRSRSTNAKPPSTSRTRREMRVAVSGSSSVGAGYSSGHRMSSGRSVFSEDGHQSLRSAPDDNIGRDVTFGRTQSRGPPKRQRSGLMEKLFGDHVPESAKQMYTGRGDPSPRAGSAASICSWNHPDQIHSRILLTATVYHNTATNLWIATINTNQKGVAKNPATASKFLKAFSFSSEKEARESAIANAPPKMLPFADHPCCHVCNGKFAMFRRASHCRNCGVCVCNTCSVSWPAKMIPETYNLKRETQVKVCKSCNHLSTSFKKALLDGDYEEAVAIYGSGNINLRTPFPQSSKKDEIMYPIHCAVEGGNAEIVRWLIEDHFCPIKVIRTGSSKKPKRGGSADQLILTSKARSVLTIAMTSLNVEILRYLVVDNGVSIYESKDLKSSLRALEAVLLAFPSNSGGRRVIASVNPRWDDRSFDGQSCTSSLGADQTVGGNTFTSSGTKRQSSDSCIICYENSINCVMTPCGHQVCCLNCSKSLKSCPVCNVKGEFIRIFRP